MEILEGYVEHIVYRNSDNGYTVLNLVSGDEEITCVGMLPLLAEGELIQAQGRYTEHATYGEQFRIESYQEKTPEDRLAIERYLGSGAIRGVGSALAARIVRRFKEDTFRIIEMEPERLAEIKGISERKAREIAQQVEEKKDMREAMIFLQRIRHIFGQSGGENLPAIRPCPLPRHPGKSIPAWQTTFEGVGFQMADEIAQRAGIHTRFSDYRIRRPGFFIPFLQPASMEGHTYLPQRRAEPQKPADLLERPYWASMDKYLDGSCSLTGKTPGGPGTGRMNDYRVYAAAQYYHLELNTAKMLHDLNVTGEIDKEKILEKIQKIDRRNQTVLDEMQREAIIQAVRCGLTVITGGPGTGKTTTINTMISFFMEEGLEIALAAPTGRAAKRMTEATGYEARTIHRLLEVAGGPDSGSALRKKCG